MRVESYVIPNEFSFNQNFSLDFEPRPQKHGGPKGNGVVGYVLVSTTPGPVLHRAGSFPSTAI